MVQTGMLSDVVTQLNATGDFVVNSTYVTEGSTCTNETMNERTYELKDENYIHQGINTRGILIMTMMMINVQPCYFKNSIRHLLLETSILLGDNCIQNILCGRYIVGYTVGNLVLRRHTSGALIRDFLPYN